MLSLKWNHKWSCFDTDNARAVERIIGRRVGTGGSSGVNYLDAKHLFVFLLTCGSRSNITFTEGTKTTT